jgi:hypothetical protein
MDCFVAVAPRNDVDTPPPSHGAIAPESCVKSFAHKGVGNAGRAMRPQPRMQNEKAHECRHHGRAEITRHSRTRVVLTVSFALSLVTGLFCHHRKRNAQALSPT